MILLAVAGAGHLLLEVATRTLLQRSVPPRLIGRIFGVLEGFTMAGLAVGALLVPALAHLGGSRLAVLGVAAVLPLAAVAGGRAVFRLDAGTAVPVVEIALLRSLPLFAELPAPAIEGLAAALRPVRLEAGAVLIRQGDPGDAYFAIAAGELDAEQDGHFLGRYGRGDGVGEIALLRAVPAHRDRDRAHGRDRVPAGPGPLPDRGARARPDPAAGRRYRRGAAGHRRIGRRTAMEHPLAMDVEAMRRAGYATVDALVARLADPEADPVLRRADAADMRARLGGPPPEQPGDYGAVLARVLADVLPFAARTDHPGYLAFIPSFTTWPAALAELTAAAANPYCGAWLESAGPAQVELEVIDWFRGWLGLPAGTAGVLVNGGSAANLTALLVAREAAGGPSPGSVVYVSDQAHSSLARTARAMGLRPEQVRVLPTDGRWRLRAGHGGRGRPGRPRRGPYPVRPVRQRRVDQHRRRRPAGRPGRRLRGRTAVAARRRGLRRLRRADRQGQGGCWPASSAPTR